MNDAVHLAVGTLTMRPYVFAFFAAYLLAAVPHLGWRKTAAFTVSGYLIAFLSEWSSINNGFPYGWYFYIDRTSTRELWIAGVPFFDSLSYVFLCYCSYTMALLVLSPLKACHGDFVTLETGVIRRSFAVLLLGSLFQAYLDIIIDPVSLQGSRWFLGQIYGYRERGYHFGVPLSNYLGWWLVGALMILALQRIDRLWHGNGRPTGVCSLPFRSLFGPALYVSVLAFNLTVAMLIGEWTVAMTGLFIVFLPLVMIATLTVRRLNRYTQDELAAHLQDYPYSPAAAKR